MNTLTQAKASTLDLIMQEGGLDDLNALNPSQKSDLFAKLGVVQLVMSAAYGTKQSVVKSQARVLRVSEQAINQWLAAYKRHGFRGLIDGRRSAAKARAMLPEVTAQWIKDEILRQGPRRDVVKEVHRAVIAQWNLWRRTGDPVHALPGFYTCPPDCGKGYPAGFSIENFRRCSPSAYQKSLAGQGTISAYRSLPSILSTCVGTRYLEYVFFDDEKPDVNVRVPGYERPMVPLCFHALDRLTRFPFRPHIRLRWYDTDENKHRHLTQKEFVFYVIWLLCTEGYRTDEVGTWLIQEHGTAKVWANQSLRTPDGYHSFEDALKSITSGKVRLDSSGLFNKPAFKELVYGPKSTGNPRFKAPIESSFRLWRTYSSNLIGQTGQSYDLAPEENYGITKYEQSIIRRIEGLPSYIQDAVVSNYLTGIEFATVAELIREALASRDDHDFEGWYESGFVEPVWRWAEDPVGLWRSRKELADLPPNLREHALIQQQRDPHLSKLNPWSPAVARMSCLKDPAISKLSFTDAVHLVPTDWLKPVTVRDRHEIHLTEELLPGMELVYLPEMTTPRGRVEYLQPGDELMILLNPLMPDDVIVYDTSFNLLGTITRNIRTGRNMEQVEAMFKQRSRLKTALEAPVRRAMQPVADRRDAVRRLNDDLITKARLEADGKPATTSEQRSASAQQGQRTAAANRLQAKAPAYDDGSYTPETSSAWNDVPDDEAPLPDAL